MKTTVSLPFAILLGLVSFSHGPASGQDQAVRPSGGQTSVPTAAILSHPKEDPFRHLRHAPRSDGQAAEVSPFACVTNNGTITITKYVATSRKVETRNGIVPLLADLADETATIPAALHGCPVVEIGANAFANCTRLTSIQIPEGVRLIGDGAFRWCPGLQTLQLPASVTSMHATAFADCPGLVAIRVDDANPVYWNDADGVVFSKDKKTLVRYPSGLTGDYKVPDTVAVVGDFAFVGCRELKTVELPVGVTSVGPWAFADCSVLTSIAFPDSLAKIGEFAFWGCGCLTGLSIPDSVTNIGYFTFAHCHGLTAATLPRSVTAMGPNVFRNCGRLTNIVVAAENPAFCSIDGVVFDKQKTRLIAYPCGRTGSYVVPDGVTYVDQSSFRGAGLVTSVTLPRTVTGLGYKAFLSCGNVDGFFFSGDAPGLRRDALAGCGRATAYHRTQARRWGKDFGGRPTGAWDPAHPFAYTNINGQVTVTRYASPDETALVPDMIDGLPVAAIGPSAFQNCRHLTRVVLPATLTRIGVSAFRDCVSLADVAIPPGVATVERSAFQGCASLADVGLADGVRKIDASAFAGCAKLTEVRLPASVAIVGANAFADCPSLAAIRADDGNPAFRSDKDGVLFSKDKATLVCYPVGKAGKYAVPSCVTNIGPNAFESCTGLTSVAFSSRLVSIGGRAFARCRSLSVVTFSKGLVNIGAGAFQDCAGLPPVALPERVASLGDFAFWNCPRLTRVSLPASVVRIGGTTFGRCGGLTAVDVADANTAYCSDNGVVFCKDKTVLVCFPSGRGGRYAVPDHVTQIGRSAFESCGKVADIVMSDRVERVGDFAFKNCGALTNAVLSARLAELGIEAFSGCAGLSRVSVPVSVSRIGDRAFQSCPNLAEIRFGGNAPRPGRTVFRSSPKAVVYRQPDAQGWGTEFAGRPTAVWDLPAHSPAFSTSVTMADSTLSNAVSRVTARPDLRRRSSKLNSSVILNSGDYFYKTNSARQAIITGFNSNYIGALSITNILGGCPVSSIWPWGFMNCTFLTAVSIPSGISYIAPQALTRCPALKTFMVDAGNATYSSLDGVLFNKERTELIKFPGNKTGHYTIPEGTTRIGYWAFKACNNISEVSIPSSVTNIGSEAFDECANLTAITAAKGHPLFSSVAGVLFDKTQTRLIAFPGGKAGHYTLPPSVTNIGSVSFAFCKNLTGVTIPDSVTDLDTMAFYSCVKLTGVTIPDHVTSIGRSAFGDCDNLTCVTVGKGVISIGPSAFSRSLNLRDVFFRGNAPRLGPDVFQYNNRVTVHYQAGTMGWGKEFGGRPTAVWKP